MATTSRLSACPKLPTRTLATAGFATASFAAAALAAVTVAASPAAADPSGPQTVTIHATADTYGNALHPSTTYGTTADLRAGNGYGGTKTSFLRFAVPADQAARVTAAKLVLTRTARHLPVTSVTARSTSVSWTEASLSAANAPAVGAALDTAAVDGTTTAVTLNVTAAATGHSDVALALTSPAANDIAAFNSRQASAGVPALVLTLKPAAPPCTVSPVLVSSCKVWLGDAPQAHQLGTLTPTQRLAIDEGFTGRRFDILHEYQVNGTLFPNAEMIGLANQGRLLYENWKPATDMSWARVAAGGADSRIDAEAAYLNSHFSVPFFLAIYHEPEDNVNPATGSGMTTADYVAMYRHVVQRLRADGVTKVVTVMNYMGYYRWDPMRDALYPGDDVVNWIAWDPYMHSPDNTPGHDFAAEVNTAHGTSPGFYTWATTAHPSKPLMLGEFGAYDNNVAANPGGQARYYATVTGELSHFPAFKALVHFTMNPADVPAGEGTQPNETPSGALAWRQLASAPVFTGPAQP
jgi:hypothetical protein